MKKRVSILYKDIENTFQGFFGTKVKLNPGKKKGKIVIEYASNDEDASTIHKMTTFGICVLDPTRTMSIIPAILQG